MMTNTTTTSSNIAAKKKAQIGQLPPPAAIIDTVSLEPKLPQNGGPIKATHKLDKSLPKKKETSIADNTMYEQESENMTTLKNYEHRDELEPLNENPDKKFKTAMDRL